MMSGTTFLQRRLSPLLTWGMAELALVVPGQRLQAVGHLIQDVSCLGQLLWWLLQVGRLGNDVIHEDLRMVWIPLMPRAASEPMLVGALAAQTDLKEAVDCVLLP
jgi:hypothetical protein